MKTTTVTARRPGALNASANNGKTKDAAAATLSLRRLNVIRIGYAVMGVGIAVRNWPLLVNRSEPWPRIASTNLAAPCSSFSTTSRWLTD